MSNLWNSSLWNEQYDKNVDSNSLMRTYKFKK